MTTNGISPNAGIALPQHHHYLDRVSNLDKRIKANVASGNLTEEQGQSFEESLQGIVDSLNSTREANGGYLTVQDRVQANKDMNNLLGQIRSAAHPNG